MSLIRAPEAVHQRRVIDVVEARLDVGLQHPLVRLRREVVDLGDRVLRAPVRPEPVGDRLEVGLEDRFQDQLQRGLHDPVGHGRDPQRPQFPAGLGNHHLPHRCRGEGPRPQLIADLVQERLDPVPGFDPGHGGPVDPGSARARVARDAFPRHGQHVRVAHQVVQIIEPAGAVRARPAVQLALNPPYRRERLTQARPRGGAGIHRRVFGHDSHFLLLSLSPFPMWPALPTSEYYGDSAPSAPFGRQRAYPHSRERRADGSHVHCCPVDGRGARLCPCGLVVATPQTFTTTCRARHISPSRQFPTPGHRLDDGPRHGYAPHSSPDPPGSSWSTIKRLYDTGSLRAPSRLAHQARPVR